MPCFVGQTLQSQMIIIFQIKNKNMQKKPSFEQLDVKKILAFCREKLLKYH